MTGLRHFSEREVVIMQEQKMRHEYKFLCDESKWTLIRARLRPLMRRDAHTGEQDHYEIRSVYFDDYRDTCYHRNDAGTDPRAKYRIRAYNGSDEVIRLEKKIKKQGMTGKRSCPLSTKQYECLMAEDYGSILREVMQTDFASGQEELLREFAVLGLTRHMQPKVIVSYERFPLIDPAGNVRVTFDKNIAAGVAFEDFFEEHPRRMPVMPTGQHLLEVKYDGFLPEYIRELLENGSLRQTTFSKYYICRQERMRR